MTQTEALKLALEALEDLNGMAQFFPDELYSDHPDVMKAAQAITAIKEVLAQQCVCCEPDSTGTHRTDGPCLAPQSTWVGLTDEEISELIRATHNTGSFVRAIEAKLKGKNT